MLLTMITSSSPSSESKYQNKNYFQTVPTFFETEKPRQDYINPRYRPTFKYSLVQWNWFSDVTSCMYSWSGAFSDVSQRNNFTSPSCAVIWQFFNVETPVMSDHEAWSLNFFYVEGRTLTWSTRVNSYSFRVLFGCPGLFQWLMLTVNSEIKVTPVLFVVKLVNYITHCRSRLWWVLCLPSCGKSHTFSQPEEHTNIYTRPSNINLGRHLQ